MDFITEIFDYIGNLEGYFRTFIEISVKFPLLGVLISLPIIAVLIYTFVERAFDFIHKLRTSNENQRQKKFFLILVLSCSTFLSIILVDNIVRANTVRPIFLDREGEIIDLEKNELQPMTIIGNNISLQWQYERENELKRKLLKKNQQFRYGIERSEDINFSKPQL